MTQATAVDGMYSWRYLSPYLLGCWPLRFAPTPTRSRTARAAQATACGKRRAHCATPLACHARQAGRGRCCRRACAARRARVAWARARQGQAPAVRRGATQGAGWASGWLGHCRLSTFVRQDVSAALLMATSRRARRSAVCAPASDKTNVRALGRPGLSSWYSARFGSCATFPSLEDRGRHAERNERVPL